MSKRLITKEFIEKATEVHNGKYDYSKLVYGNSRTKVTIVCPEHGIFEQRASLHLLGSGCPVCARIWSDEHKQHLQESSRKSRGMTTEEWIERAKAVHGDKYDYSQTVYVNQRTNVRIICPKHGAFEQKADSHIKGIGCRACGYESENHKGKHSWSDEQRAKTVATCRKKYGTDRYLDSDEGKEKIVRIKSDPDFRDKMSRIISSDEVQEKTKATCVSKYGVTSSMKLHDTIQKVWESKKKNGTWSSSKPENKMYSVLCDKFGENNVERQYDKDARYPFHCDFYIKSLDLFIELNGTWLHGYHWFNENDENDLIRLSELKQKFELGKQLYGVAIKIWTVSDIRKRDTAIRNRLNYLVFWKNNLSDFKNWIESESLVLNNVL